MSYTGNVSLLQNLNTCVIDFYFQNDELHYQKADNELWYTTTTNITTIDANYYYDATINKCYVFSSMSDLGMSESSYQFLMGLTGSLVGCTLLIGLLIVASRK